MIGIFDSGIGGLSVFREVRKSLPGQEYIYYADSAHCPYGEKSREYVTGRAREISGFLIREGADVIVVACNTATAAAIATLRREFSDPSDPAVRQRVMEISSGRRDHIRFIGMEPAVKPAAGLTRTGIIGVLATAGTLKGLKYRATREMFAKGIKVVEHVGQGFVELVEKGIVNGPQAEATVSKSLVPLLDAGADVIVLGCTHYPFLMGPIRKIAGDGVTVIDPAPAVARHLVEVMKEDGLLSAGNAPEVSGDPGSVRLCSSADPAVLESMFRKLLK